MLNSIILQKRRLQCYIESVKRRHTKKTNRLPTVVLSRSSGQFGVPAFSIEAYRMITSSPRDAERIPFGPILATQLSESERGRLSLTGTAINGGTSSPSHCSY